MKISSIYTERLYDSCETLEEELLIDKKIKDIKTIAKTNGNIIMDRDYIFIIGDVEKILDVDKCVIEDIIYFLNCNNCSDEVDIEGIKFLKDDCIKMLDKHLKEDNEELTLLLFDLFSNAEVKDFSEKLINSQFKYVAQEKINILQNIIEDGCVDIQWR